MKGKIILITGPAPKKRLPVPTKAGKVILPATVYQRKRENDRFCKEVKEYLK